MGRVDGVAVEAETGDDERKEETRDRLRRDRLVRIAGGAFPAGQGDDWLHQLAPSSTPVVEPTAGAPAVAEPPRHPPKAPQGARDGPVSPPSGDAWLRGALDAARFGGSTWSTSTSEPGTWVRT